MSESDEIEKEAVTVEMLGSRALMRLATCIARETLLDGEDGLKHQSAMTLEEAGQHSLDLVWMAMVCGMDGPGHWAAFERSRSRVFEILKTKREAAK